MTVNILRDGQIISVPDASVIVPETLASAFKRISSKNRADCKTKILSVYTEEVQRNAGLGVYSTGYVDTMSAYIAACIAEENRVYSLLAAATTVNEILAVESPVFPEVYVISYSPAAGGKALKTRRLVSRDAEANKLLKQGSTAAALQLYIGK